MCSIQTMATPWSRRPRIVATSSSASASVRPAPISSSSSTSRPGGERAGQLEPLAVQEAETLRRAGWRVRSARTARSRPRVRRSQARRLLRPAPAEAPTSTFSSTVIPTNGRGTWNARPMPRRQRTAGRTRRHVGAAQRHRAGVLRDGAGQDVEQRRLPGAVRPDDADRLALVDVEVHAVQHRRAARTASADLCPAGRLGSPAQRVLRSWVLPSWVQCGALGRVAGRSGVGLQRRGDRDVLVGGVLADHEVRAGTCRWSP